MKTTKWIDCSMELPPFGEIVVVANVDYTDQKGRPVVNINERARGNISVYANGFINNGVFEPTHWMRIPTIELADLETYKEKITRINRKYRQGGIKALTVKEHNFIKLVWAKKTSQYKIAANADEKNDRREFTKKLIADTQKWNRK